MNLAGGNPVTFTFSDLIVNVTAIEGEYARDGNLIYLIHNHFRTLGLMRALLTDDGIFVRGGITIGDIFIDDRTVFGPALVRAYELESATAKWPIIAIDPALIEQINQAADIYCHCRRSNEGGFDKMEESIFRRNAFEQFTTQDDGIYFLDYLECMAYDDLTTGDLDYKLEDHKNNVLAAYTKYKHYKYAFIADYHDKKCREHRLNHTRFLIGHLA